MDNFSYASIKREYISASSLMQDGAAKLSVVNIVERLGDLLGAVKHLGGLTYKKNPYVCCRW